MQTRLGRERRQAAPDPLPEPVELLLALSSEAAGAELESFYRRMGGPIHLPQLRRDATISSLLSLGLGDEPLPAATFEFQPLSATSCRLTVVPYKAGDWLIYLEDPVEDLLSGLVPGPDRQCVEFCRGFIEHLTRKGYVEQGGTSAAERTEDGPAMYHGGSPELSSDASAANEYAAGTLIYRAEFEDSDAGLVFALDDMGVTCDRTQRTPGAAVYVPSEQLQPLTRLRMRRLAGRTAFDWWTVPTAIAEDVTHVIKQVTDSMQRPGMPWHGLAPEKVGGQPVDSTKGITGSAPDRLGPHGGTMDRVREARDLVRKGEYKTVACKRVGIDIRTYDRYVLDITCPDEEDDE